MPTPIAEIIKDPRFLRSRKEVQRRILAANDDKFAASRPAVQDQILSKFEINEPTDLGFLERARLSFASSPEDTERMLAAKFGPENVLRTEAGKVAYRRTPADTFRNIDEPGMSFGDVADIAGQSLPAIGATAGSLLTGGIGPQAIGGAALGGSGGEAFRQLIGRALGSETPQTSLSAAANIAGAGAIEGAMEGVGGGVAKVASIPFSAVAKRVTPQARRAMDFLRDSGITDLGPTPAQATSGPLVDILENVAQGGFFGGPLVRFKENTLVAVDKLSRGVAKGYAAGVSPDQSVPALLKILDGEIHANQAVAASMRENIILRAVRKMKVVPKSGPPQLTEGAIRLGPSQEGLEEAGRIGWAAKVDRERRLAGTDIFPPYSARRFSPVYSSEAKEGADAVARAADASARQVQLELIEERAKASGLWDIVQQNAARDVDPITQRPRLSPQEVWDQFVAAFDVVLPGTMSVGKKSLSAVQRITGKNNMRHWITRHNLRVMPDGSMPIEDAMTLRSEILNTGRKAEKVLDKSMLEFDYRDAKRAAFVMDRALVTALPEELQAQFRASNVLFRKGYEKEFIKKLLTKSSMTPGAREMLFNVTPKDIFRIRGLLGTSDPSYQIFQATALHNAMDKAMTLGEGSMKGTSLRTRLFGKGDIAGTLGVEKLDVLVGRQGREQFEKLVDTLDVLQKGSETGVGSAAIQFSQIGALTKLLQIGGGAAVATGGIAGILDGDTATLGAAGIIFGPALIARAFTNPTIRQALLNGLSDAANGNTRRAIAGLQRVATIDQQIQDALREAIREDMELEDPTNPGSVR